MPPRALIIEARFYEHLADMLLAGATAALRAREMAPEVVSVPGVLEIAPALAIALDRWPHLASGGVVVVLGCVIRGETGHYDIVANEGNRGVMELAARQGLALGNGILTVENEAQALVRADPARKNKGGAAAEAALALYDLRLRLRERQA